jgi:hypothetical protein
VINDHVVTLKAAIAAAAVAPIYETVSNALALKAPAPSKLPPTCIALAVVAEAPSGRFRLRLWDEYGRNPTDPVAKQPPLEFRGSLPRRTVVLTPKDSFDGRTLTWVIRLQASGPAQYYSVRLTVLQVDKGKETPSSEFAYSGPLDEVEEITGRFHFKVSA